VGLNQLHATISVLHTWIANGQAHAIALVHGHGLHAYSVPIDDLMGAPER
jgi:hypothetical protein